MKLHLDQLHVYQIFLGVIQVPVQRIGKALAGLK